MPITNPVKFGYAEKEKLFTYEGGKKLYHFSPHDNGLSKVMDNNLIFFADSKKHALDVLKRMCTFVVKEAKRKGGTFGKYTSEKFQTYLDKVNTGKCKIVEAPMDQFYEVGWADNDVVR